LRTEGSAVVVGTPIRVMDVAAMALRRPIALGKRELGRRLI
jgi:hypothetical protein